MNKHSKPGAEKQAPRDPREQPPARGITRPPLQQTRHEAHSDTDGHPGGLCPPGHLLAEIESYQQSPEELSFRLAVADKLRAVGEDDQAERYEHCHQIDSLVVCYCKADVSHHWLSPKSCRLRICPHCARQLGAEVKGRYLRRILAVVEDQSWRRGWSLKFVTLTSDIGLSGDIGGEVLRVLDCVRELYHALWGRFDGAGAVASLEFGEHGHKLHVHLLVWGPYFTQDELSQEWQRRSGFPVVHVRRVHSIEDGVGELLKYVTKFGELSPGQLVDLHMALKRRRRIRAWGSFYGVGEDERDGPAVCPKCGGEVGRVAVPTLRFVMQQHRVSVLAALDFVCWQSSQPTAGADDFTRYLSISRARAGPPGGQDGLLAALLDGHQRLRAALTPGQLELWPGAQQSKGGAQ